MAVWQLDLAAGARTKAGQDQRCLHLLAAGVGTRVAQLPALGATALPPGPREESGPRWFVLADPEGNEFRFAKDPDR